VISAPGFALDRSAFSAPGAGYFGLDDLELHGGLGGAVSLDLNQAHAPLRIGSAGQRLTVVGEEATAELGLAVTWSRFRFSFVVTGPLFLSGNSGSIGGYQFTAPSASVEQNPDTISDPRLGFETRLYGEPASALRLGAGVQLIIPSGLRADYLTDGTYRAKGLLLLAGDRGRFSYAAQLGVHLRPLDDDPTPGSPRGSELLFGGAGGVRIPAGAHSLFVGPELLGETALKSFFGAQTTGLEGLLTARLEGTRADGASYRIKLGVGGGLAPQFGAAEWRLVLGLELFGRHAQQ